MLRLIYLDHFDSHPFLRKDRKREESFDLKVLLSLGKGGKEEKMLPKKVPKARAAKVSNSFTLFLSRSNSTTQGKERRMRHVCVCVCVQRHQKLLSSFPLLSLSLVLIVPQFYEDSSLSLSYLPLSSTV